jgi:hypothetical protein
MRDGEPVRVLKLVTAGPNGHHDLYLLPHLVAAVEQTGEPNCCAVFTVDGRGWTVEGTAAEVQLRVWKALESTERTT